MSEDPWAQQSFDAAIGFAKEAIRGCILINGGAAAGLVAFLPNAKSAGLDIQTLVSAAVLFAWGVFFGVVTFGLSYIAQVYISEKHPSGPRERVIFSAWRYAAVGSAMLSAVFFLIGAYTAKCAVQ